MWKTGLCGLALSFVLAGLTGVASAQYEVLPPGYQTPYDVGRVPPRPSPDAGYYVELPPAVDPYGPRRSAPRGYWPATPGRYESAPYPVGRFDGELAERLTKRLDDAVEDLRDTLDDFDDRRSPFDRTFRDELKRLVKVTDDLEDAGDDKRRDRVLKEFLRFEDQWSRVGYAMSRFPLPGPLYTSIQRVEQAAEALRQQLAGVDPYWLDHRD